MGYQDAKPFGTESQDKSNAVDTTTIPMDDKFDGQPAQDEKEEGLPAVHNCVSASQIANVGRS